VVACGLDEADEDADGTEAVFVVESQGQECKVMLVMTVTPGMQVV
jgi:hypothetical protein